MLTAADFETALDDVAAGATDHVESRTSEVLALMCSIRGSARVAYATYTCRIRTDCEFDRLCAYARSCASEEGMTQTVIPAPSATRPTAAIRKRSPTPRPLSFTLKGSGTAGKVSVKFLPSFVVTVNGHIDSKGIPGLNRRLLRLVERASTFLHRGVAAKPRLTMGRVDTLHVYWFTREAVDLHAVHSTIGALIHNSDPSCPWRQGCVDTGKRALLRLSTKDGPGGFSAVSATVQPCGTISLVARCIPTLRRAVLLFAEIARASAPAVVAHTS